MQNLNVIFLLRADMPYTASSPFSYCPSPFSTVCLVSPHSLKPGGLATTTTLVWISGALDLVAPFGLRLPWLSTIRSRPRHLTAGR